MLKFYEAFQKHLVPRELNDELYDFEGNRFTTLEEFSKVNIFIGANNSGKSKLIRELIKRKPDSYYGDKNWDRIVRLINRCFSTAKTELNKICSTEAYFAISNSQNGEFINTEELADSQKRFLQYSNNYDLHNTIDYVVNKFVTQYSGINKNSAYYIRLKGQSAANLDIDQREKLLNGLNELRNHIIPIIEELKKFDISKFSQAEIPRIYIPSIRTLRLFASKAGLKEQTRIEYNFGTDVIIFNGEELPDEIFKLKNSKFPERQRITQFENLLSKEFFNSKDVKLTYDKAHHVLLIKIGDETERPIHELGDGLQMIIILTFPFFAYPSGIIAIEEPELFIHPGLQKTFLKFLMSNSVTKNFQILLATHSNHIIDSINQSDFVSLFSIKKREKINDNSVEKNPDFIIENLAFGHENLLNLLGITNTSVYLSNCTIWVEGITDKLYIQKFITEYLKTIEESSIYFQCKLYKEGINYSFALTAGDSIIHWDFSDDSEYYANTKKILVRRLCSKSLVVVDNDFSKNAERKQLLQEVLKERFIELRSPEIENLLAREVIYRTLLSYQSVSKVVEYESLPDIKGKAFQSHKIGYIIDELILKDFTSVKKFSAGDGQTASLKSGDKFVFCNKALDYITASNLTAECKTLVEQLLNFMISKNNFL